MKVIRSLLASAPVVAALFLAPLPTNAQPTPIPLPQINTPRVGAITGTFEVTETGSATYTIPLLVPPGTTDMAPKLSLEYNSQGGSGYVGVGWHLGGMSSITRCPQTISQDGAAREVRLDANDKICLDGQRLVGWTGTYGQNGSTYRTEQESYSRINFYGSFQGLIAPGFFHVDHKDGMRASYGYPTNIGLVRSGTKKEPLAWQMTRTMDVHGNTVSFSYQQDLSIGESLPSRIDYTGNTTRLTPYNSVRFVYEPRAFPEQNFVAGLPFGSNKRISRIQMFTQEQMAWEYRLDYRVDQVAREDLLTRVTQCSADGSCLAPTEFTYPQASNEDPTFESLPALYALTAAQSHTGTGRSPFLVGDWNGDGRTDLARLARNGETTTLTAYKAPSYGSSGGFTSYATLTTAAPAQRVILGDWNADTGTDLAAQINNQLDLYVTNGNSFALAGSLSPLTSDGVIHGIISGDWNADARSDVAVITGTGVTAFTTSNEGFMAFSSFSDFSPAQGYSVTCPPERPSCTAEEDFPITVADFTGDGRTDIARMGPTGLKIYASSPSGFTLYATISEFAGTRSHASPILFGDWNGDDLTDIARIGDQGTVFCRSNGVGFESCTTEPILGVAQGYIDDLRHPVAVADFNGDGTSDIVRIRSDGRAMLYLIEDSGISGPYDTMGAFPPSDSGQGNLDDPYPLIPGDWSGDGVAGLARAGTNALTFVSASFRETSSIVEISNGLGHLTKIDYRPLTSPTVYRQGTGAVYPTIDIMSAVPVVRQVESTNGLGGFYRTGYFYEALRVDAQGRGSKGFEKVTSYDYSRGTQQTTTFRQDYPFLGHPLITESRLLNETQTLMQRNTSTWEAFTHPWGSIHNRLSTELEETFEPNTGAFVSSVTKRSTFDEWGNLSQLLVERSDGTWERTENTYDEVWNWHVGILLSSKVTAGAPNTTPVERTSSFAYSLAKLVTETVQPENQDDYMARHHYPDYTLFGNNTNETIRGRSFQRIRRYDFDERGQFRTSSTDPLGRVTLLQHEPLLGKLVRLQDPNGLVTTWSHDLFGRETLETRPDGTQSRTLILEASGDAPSHAAYMKRIDVSGAPVQIIYFDALNREILRETEGFDGTRILVEQVYDDRGQLSHQSLPYFRGETPRWKVHEYDAAGREIRTIEPGDSGTRQTLFKHDGLTTTTTNAIGHHAIITSNIQGKVVRSEDNDGNVLTFKYDGLGQQISAIDPAGNETVMTYNSRGNRISIREPNSGTTTFTYNAVGELLTQTNAKGQTVRFTYDNLGRVLTRVRPEGTDRWTYDTAANGLGKIARIVGADGYEESYTYDTLGRVSSTTRRMNGKTFVVSTVYDEYSRPKDLVYPTGFAVKHLYNSRGYLSEVRNRANNGLFWKAEKRNALGQLEQHLLGNGLRTSHKFSENTGLVKRIQTGSIQDLEFAFDDLGNLTDRRDARVGAHERFEYDSLNRLTLAQVETGGFEPQQVEYDRLGNITFRSDVGNYYYGELGAGPHAVSRIEGLKPNRYDYDLAGNRIASQEGFSEYDSSGVPTRITAHTSDLRFKVDPEGDRYLEDVFKDGTLRERKYMLGKLFERVERGVSVSELHYINGPDGVVAVYQPIALTDVSEDSDEDEAELAGRSIGPRIDIAGRSVTESSVKPASSSAGIAIKSPIPAGGGATTLEVAHHAINAARILYLHRDHLGSIQSITDERARLIEVRSFDSWGNRRDPASWGPLTVSTSSTIDRGFTGHEHLDEVKLIHMNGRIYDPIIGRFLSPDPIVQSPLDLQNYNRYSYVLNNPLSLTDPDGFSWRGFWRRLRGFLRRAITIAFVAAATYFTGGAITSALGPILSGALGSVAGTVATAAISAAGAGFASGFAGTLAAGGSLSDAFKMGLRAAPMSAARGILTFGIGGIENAAMRAFAHGAAGAAFSAVQGGDVAGGFLSGLTSSMGGGGNALRSAMLGGVASSLTGGKFLDGALQGTFIHLYNDSMHPQGESQKPTRAPSTLATGGCGTNGSRDLAVWASSGFPAGTVGSLVGSAVSNAYSIVGNLWSGDIGYHYMEAESQRLMGLPATEANVRFFANRETAWWGRQAGMPGMVGSALNSEGRQTLLRGTLADKLASTPRGF